MQHLAVVRLAVRAVSLLHPRDRPADVHGEAEEDRPQREEGPVLEEPLHRRARLAHRVDVIEGALDVPEKGDDGDEEQGEADRAQRLHRRLAGERRQRARDGGACPDAELRIDIALDTVVELRLPREQVDHAVEHCQQRDQGEERQIGERRRPQRDGFAPEAAADEHQRADQPANGGKRAYPVADRREAGSDARVQSPTFAAGTWAVGSADGRACSGRCCCGGRLPSRRPPSRRPCPRCACCSSGRLHLAWRSYCSRWYCGCGRTVMLLLSFIIRRRIASRSGPCRSFATSGWQEITSWSSRCLPAARWTSRMMSYAMVALLRT